jgi:hypothetical protein
MELTTMLLRSKIATAIHFHTTGLVMDFVTACQAIAQRVSNPQRAEVKPGGTSTATLSVATTEIAASLDPVVL